MGEISNISSVAQNINTQVTKPTLQVGQVFSAKVVQINKGDNEIVLKLSDGEEINAKLQGATDININGQNKFVVKGYENGEISIAKVTSDTNKSSMDNIIKQCFGNNISSQDYSMIKALVKYGVPLTKENILYAKTVLDFQSSMKDNPLKASDFTDIYLKSRGISENSNNFKEITSILKTFTDELKNSSLQDVATFIENGVELSGENIKSFNNVFKNDSFMFNSLASIKQDIDKTDIDIDIDKTDTGMRNINLSSTNINPKTNHIDQDIDKVNTGMQNIKSSSTMINPKIDPKISSIINIVIENNSKGGGIMAGISNVNGQGGIQNKYTRKLSFDVGDVFGAKVDSYDEEKGEVVLKLSDGWKFNAKLDSTVNLTQNAFSKFAVEGYEGGKIIIKKVTVEETNAPKEDTLNSSLKEYGGENLTTEDLNMLKTLLKHGIPLTKENISYGKTVMDFRTGIIETPENEDKFISSYLDSKGIDENSNEGQNIKNTVKNFFTELKGFNTDEMATFIENGIDITDKNIKSFNNVFGKNSTINNELQELKQEIQNVISPKGVAEPEKSLTNNVEDMIKDNTTNNVNNISGSKAVIDQIDSKINDMKDAIKQLTSVGDLNKNGMEKVLNALNNNLNDFKVFNKMSEGYYYMDVPVSFKDNDYNCKLIVKDDRKSGKKIDSKNVKLATSIKTANMGVIDAFITVNNKNLSVDIKSEGKWIKSLESTKNILMNSVKKMGYNVNINVNEKKDELNIVSCRNFFNNDVVAKLDTRV